MRLSIFVAPKLSIFVAKLGAYILYAPTKGKGVLRIRKSLIWQDCILYK